MVSADASDQAAQGASEPGSAQWPPAGWVTVVGAARMLGVTGGTLREWVRVGRLGYAGEIIPSRDGRRQVRVYEVAELERAMARMRDATAARATLPDGYISRDEAAALLGIGPKTLGLWHRNGKLRRCGVWVTTANGTRTKIYPRAEVERVRDELAAAAANAAELPDGFVDREGARRMFGVCMMTLSNWERAGTLRCGRRVEKIRRNGPRKLYAIDELRPLVEALRGAGAVYRTSDLQIHIPAGFVNADEAASRFGVSKAVLTRWEEQGQIACGGRFMGQGIRVYPVAELERLVAECGRYSPPYPDPDRPGVYRVPLGGHDMKRREAIIDAANAPLLADKRFHFSLDDGAPEHHGRVLVANTRIRLHQLILGLSGNEWKVGHLNGDPLDCRRENLVVRTRSECGANMRKARTIGGRPTSSRFKGVCWSKKREKWVVHIKKDQVSRSLGSYHDEIAAAEAYDEAARELFGEHARLNFPDGVDAYLAAENCHDEGDARAAA